MKITELAAKIKVDARQLDKALIAREYTDYGIVPDDIAEDLLALYEHYSSALIIPIIKGTAIDVSFMHKPCIYFLFDGNSISYIGKSTNLLQRLANHANTKEWDGIFITEVPRKDIDIFEAFYISLYKPRDNKDGLNPMDKINMLIRKI